MDEDEERALLRLRVLRRDGYRCRHRNGPRARLCGAFAGWVGTDPEEGEIVALCLAHAPGRA